MRVTDSPHFVGLTPHGAPSRVASEPALGRGNGEEEQEASGPASRRVSPSTRSRPVGDGDASSVKVGAWVRARLCLSPAAIRVPPPLAAGVRCGAARSDPLAGAACWGRGWRSGRRCVKTNEHVIRSHLSGMETPSLSLSLSRRCGVAARKAGRRAATHGGVVQTTLSERLIRKVFRARCRGRACAAREQGRLSAEAGPAGRCRVSALTEPGESAAPGAGRVSGGLACLSYGPN